jgi:plastocyanin domain-containing protein
MNKQILIALSIIVLGLFGVAAFHFGGTSDDASITGAVVAPTGSFQEVKLSFENYAYVLTPDTFTKDVPVRMTVDMSTVGGCMRDVRIAQFGVSKYVSEGDNIIEFTPTKAGTFNIACSMNMGRGTFTVLDSDGTEAQFVEAAPIAPAGGCGSGAGGCGCGSGAA